MQMILKDSIVTIQPKRLDKSRQDLENGQSVILPAAQVSIDPGSDYNLLDSDWLTIFLGQKKYQHQVNRMEKWNSKLQAHLTNYNIKMNSN